jgi:hypothetical protein
MEAYLDEQCIMSDALVQKLANKGASVDTPESLLSVINWDPYNKDVLQDLTRTIVDFNDKQSKKTRGQKRAKVSGAHNQGGIQDQAVEADTTLVQDEDVEADTTLVQDGDVEADIPLVQDQDVETDTTLAAQSTVLPLTREVVETSKSPRQLQRALSCSILSGQFVISTPSFCQKGDRSQASTRDKAPPLQASRNFQRTRSVSSIGQFRMSTPASFQVASQSQASSQNTITRTSMLQAARQFQRTLSLNNNRNKSFSDQDLQ